MIEIIGLLVLLILILIAYTVNKIFNKTDYMSFKEAMELVELPVITFYLNDKKLHFLLDTGSNNSIINEKIAKLIKAKTLDKTNKVFGVDGIVHETNLINLSLSYKNKFYEDTFQVLDMTAPFSKIKKDTGVTLHGIIGSKFMERYKYVLDFKEMVAYSKK